MKKAFILFFFSISVNLMAQTMNIFDKQNTENFAAYLQNTGQFAFAAEEFERLHFFDPLNTLYARQFLKNYRLAQLTEKGIARYKYLTDTLKMDESIKKEYYRLLVEQQKYTTVYSDIINFKPFDSKENMEWELAMLMLNKNYSEAITFAQNNQYNSNSFEILIQDYQQLQQKNIVMAATFSAIIPGTGKIYAGKWKEGIFSFLFVGASAFQAYRGFSKNGAHSLYGWLFSGIGISFYAGNVFGAIDATNSYNHELYEKYHLKVTTSYSSLLWQ
jgi:TM2 domain-containing membrane protein YozV